MAELRDMAAGLQPARWQILPSGFDPCLLHIKAIFRVRNKISSVLGSPGECLLGYRPPTSDGVARALRSLLLLCSPFAQEIVPFVSTQVVGLIATEGQSTL